MLQATYKNLGVASNATYWSTARSGGADGLGIVSPYRPEVNRTLTGLGIVPNDFELARQYGWYTPVDHGWIIGRDRWWPGGNLGAAETDNQKMLQELVKAEQLKAKMAVVSAIGVTIAAGIAIWRAVKSKGEQF